MSKIIFIQNTFQCSETCGTGLQYREVKCMDIHHNTVLDCEPTERPERRTTCNTNACPARAGSSRHTTSNQRRPSNAHHHHSGYRPHSHLLLTEILNCF